MGTQNSILVVEDNPVWMWTSRRVLDNAWNLVIVDTPSKGMLEVRAHGPEMALIIVAQCVREGVSGTTFIERIRHIGYGGPIILTSYDVISVSMPYVTFLRKPYRDDTLLATVQSLIEPGAC